MGYFGEARVQALAYADEAHERETDFATIHDSARETRDYHVGAAENIGKILGHLASAKDLIDEVVSGLADQAGDIERVRVDAEESTELGKALPPALATFFDVTPATNDYAGPAQKNAANMASSAKDGLTAAQTLAGAAEARAERAAAIVQALENLLAEAQALQQEVGTDAVGAATEMLDKYQEASVFAGLTQGNLIGYAGMIGGTNGNNGNGS